MAASKAADHLIRINITSNSFLAGAMEVRVMGTFSPEDVDDVIQTLEMAARIVRRQAAPHDAERGE